MLHNLSGPVPPPSGHGHFRLRPGWAIFYLWPFSNWMFDNTHLSWDFYSWQNLSIAAALLIWTLIIAVRKGRTPLEAIMPDLDRQLVRVVRKPLKWSNDL